MDVNSFFIANVQVAYNFNHVIQKYKDITYLMLSVQRLILNNDLNILYI